MAKSLRSKREKRLRAIRREIVEKESFQQKKEAAKLAALEAALAAPKLLVRSPPGSSSAASMDITAVTTGTTNIDTDVEMGDGNQTKDFLKPSGRIGKKSKKFKLGKKKRHGKGILRKKHV